MQMACMIFEIIVEIIDISDENFPFFESMCGCWVGCFEVGTCGMYLWVYDSSPPSI
jgi:hypothetical protein